MPQERPFGITHRFQRLFQSEGYVGYVLLTLSPLYLSEDVRARLACLIHTASVRSEPGSNPSVELIWLCFFVESSLTSQPFPVCARRRHVGGTDRFEAKTRSHSNSRVTLFSKNVSHEGWSTSSAGQSSHARSRPVRVASFRPSEVPELRGSDSCERFAAGWAGLSVAPRACSKA